MFRVGTSGWRYPAWRGVFYPPGLPHRRELEYISRRVNSLEINGSFYALQSPASYQRWAATVPPGFAFAVKGPRFITHMKRLSGIDTPLANFLASGPLALGAALGPVLWQLPPSLSFDPGLIAQFVAKLPATTTAAAEIAAQHNEKVTKGSYLRVDAQKPLRHAIEVRHPSFVQPGFFELMRAHGIAIVTADSAGRFPCLSELTADFAYVRLHGAGELYVTGYDHAALSRWASTIREWELPTYIYFDNDVQARAPFDAAALAGLLAGSEGVTAR